MNLTFEDEVAQDFESISDKIENKILRKLLELEDNPLPENSYVIQLPDGTEIQCLKIQEEYRNSELNHRVTYDIKGEEVRIYGIFQHGNRGTKI
jgi:mRNA-degrading endonuclease RelE of RelBE toxin-antitoxin system